MPSPSAPRSHGPTAHFAESIPLGMEDLAGTEGVEATADALIRLTTSSRKRIDLTAMYWALQPNPHGRDEKGWNPADLEKNYGADRGVALYRALTDAAKRGVRIRILGSPGFDPAEQEDALLETRFPDRVQRRLVEMDRWYGGGIMHQKIWIFDDCHVYLGSANMDWKSLTQVKEVGVVIENSADVAAEVGQYFETWWRFASLCPAAEWNAAEVWDPSSRIRRRVPGWSPLVPSGIAIPNPLDLPTLRCRWSWKNPQTVRLNEEDGYLVLSGAPAEICVGARSFDGDVLVDTILDAHESVSISVMDFAPVSLFRGRFDKSTKKNMIGDRVAAPVWWPALVDALLHVVTTRQVHGRLLVSEWAHSSDFITPYLEALAATADAASADSRMEPGKLEIRRLRVPGWERTGPKLDDTGETASPIPLYPGHTRVNHTKYIVTDRRLNVGTSNMTWDYFSGTAGASFNACHPALVARLQEIFDRDWSSKYALPIDS